MRLDLRNLLIGDVNRLRYIQRYGTSLVMHRENVAEHCYYVSLYAFFLAKWLKSTSDIPVNMETILVRALFHDMDEARSGDFQRPFKYSNMVMKHAIEEQCAIEFNDMITLLVGECDLVENLAVQWSYAKDETPEGIIIEIADYLSVVSYLWQESMAVSQTMAAHYETMQKHVRHFRSKKYELFRPIIDETEEILKSIQGGRK